MAPVRRSYTLDYKICILNRLKELKGNISATSRESNIDRRRIREWQSKEAEMRELERKSAAKGTNARKPRTLSYNRKGKFLEMERDLFSWITAQHKDGILIDGLAIREKAKQLVTLSDSTADFKASKGWLNRFVHRFKLVGMRIMTVEPKLPDDNLADIVETFFSEIQELCLANQIESNNIACVAEVQMHFSKFEFTLVLSALADGTKLNPMVIFKELTTPNGHFSPDCFVTCAPDGSLSKELCLQWIGRVWSKPIRKPALLLLGKHFDSEVDEVLLEQHETRSFYIPVGMTCLLDPCTVAWNKNKSTKERKWSEEKVESALESASYECVVDWVVQVWQDVPAQLIVESFEKCGLTKSFQVSQLHADLKKLLTDRTFVQDLISDSSCDSHPTDPQ